MLTSFNESLSRERRNTISGSKLLTNIMKKFTNGMTNSASDKLNRTSTSCVAAYVPTKEINRWV